MSVPVQTWGSLGTMVKEQKEFGELTAAYLEANEVHDLFAHLLRQVLVHQPDNPIKFLQEQLRSKPPLTVCVIGPLGSIRKKFCKQIASDFGIKHIDVGQVLKGKKELAAVIARGDLVEDNTVIEAVKAETAKAKNGWVLEGFPRTKIQAQSLAVKEMGFSLDKILLLNTPEKDIRKQFEDRLKKGAFGQADREDAVSMRLQQYQRHVLSIVELFNNVIRQIEVSTGDDDQNVTYNIIKSSLHMRPYSNAPLRSHRVCIVGPCGSGRTTQCKLLAKNYGLVHVDLATLLRQHQKDSGQAVEEVPPENVGDEELCAMVGKRLNEIDCVRKGWVLDGFPKTRAQGEFLRQSHLWPTRLIHLRVSPETCAQRISTRKLDPVTGTAYYRSPDSVTIRQRLVQAAHDQPDDVKQRCQLHQDNIDRVMQTFPMLSSAVSGEEEADKVTKALKDKIDTPLPSELAQEPDEH